MLKASLKKRIQEKLKGLVAEKAAPGFQLTLGFRKETLGCFTVGLGDMKWRQPVFENTWFDLASMTKILVTVDLIMRAYQTKLLPDLDLPLKNWFSFFSSDLKNRTILDLLNHRAGLPPVFDKVDEEISSREDRVKHVLRTVDESYVPPASDAPAVYSDVGFMLLGFVLEQIHGRRLRHIYESRNPLSFGPVRFGWQWISWLTQSSTVAGIQNLEAKPKWIRGDVQDPRASWLGGDAGHAGLFGTGLGVEYWAKDLYLAYHGKSTRLSDKVVRKFIDFENRSGSGSFMNGFDTPSKEGSQAGTLFSREGTVGHLGYTGCSLWMDIESGARVCLLSHRFQPGIDSDVLKRLRPAFHDWCQAEVFSTLNTWRT